MRLAEAEAALATLDEAVGKNVRSLLERDGAILRLVYTFEAVWKGCQQLLAEREGVIASSPNSTIRAARRVGWLSDEDARAILENVKGFFTLLLEWETNEQQKKGGGQDDSYCAKSA